MTGAPDAGPGIAIFDFDDTLIAGDSLPAFLAELSGPLRARTAIVSALLRALVAHALGRAPGADFRGSVKAFMLSGAVAGRTVEEARAAARRLKPRLRWLAPQVDTLRSHAAAGRRVVVVSGALDVYLPVLLEELPVTDILATDLEVDGGVLTGRLKTVNCVRAAKAERIRAFLAAHAPTGPTWGYGNRPHDLPMLALVDHPAVI